MLLSQWNGVKSCFGRCAGFGGLPGKAAYRLPTHWEESGVGEAPFLSPHRCVPPIHSYRMHGVCCCHFGKENVSTELASCVSLVLIMALKWWVPTWWTLEELWSLPLRPLPGSSRTPAWAQPMSAVVNSASNAHMKGKFKEQRRNCQWYWRKMKKTWR